MCQLPREFPEKLVISSLQSRTRPLTAVCRACEQVLILWFALTELNNVCACARLWRVKRVKRILSRWHVWFLFCGFWAFFIFRTTKNFLHPLNIFSKISFLILNTGNRRQQNASVLNPSPFSLRKFRWILKPRTVEPALLTAYLWRSISSISSIVCLMVPLLARSLITS